MLSPRRRRALAACPQLLLALPLLSATAPQGGGDWTLVGWNDLGMHCMDSAYDVFSVLPPYNTIWAQVVDANGELVDLPDGTTVTYRAVADPGGSINSTSVGKTDFWDRVLELYGVALAPDQGLAGNDMPGPANVPQPMHFDEAFDAFVAEGIPITPTDDGSRHQNYPLMRLEVRDPSGTLRATTDIVLPVSSEMDCRACHASGAGPQAEPAGGWVELDDHERDYRINLLRLHDERQAGNPDFDAALAHFGLNPAGLEATVTRDGRAILCAACHGSNALPGTGFGDVAPLTQVMHAGHAQAFDPISGMDLGLSANRSACYRCHPGSETRCLRGAMGSAVGADGTLAIQCQSCHGDMAAVGSGRRQGWFEEPNCQSCHTGSATHNNGQIRYASSFEPGGEVRQAVDALFATNPDTPAPGLDLYRFSRGHGGLQCSACHGSTHAIYASTHENDNLQSLAVQGHVGTLSDCNACHASLPTLTLDGPHGMHPIGDAFVEHHHDLIEDDDTSACAACHGADYRGTVLSRAQGERFLDAADYGDKHFWRGYQVGCYDCHDGPTSEQPSPNHVPTVADASASTPAGEPVSLQLVAADSDGDPLGLRIVEQPHSGTVSLVGSTATYFPFTGFAGEDGFTFAAADGRSESALGTVDVTVTAGWENFGEGHPGAGGVPELTLGAVPALGTTIPIDLGNPTGHPTLAIVWVGKSADYQPIPGGGVLLARRPSPRIVVLPTGGMHRMIHVPAGGTPGFQRVMQTMVRDSSASGGFALSRGLRMVYGL